MHTDLVGVGTACLDVIVLIPHLPSPDESVPMLKYGVDGGGKVSTALVAAAKLGMPTAFIGAVGDDLFGRQIVQGLQHYGVDTSGVRVQAGGTSPFSTVLADAQTKKRSILWSAGDVRLDELNDQDRAAIAGARYLLVSEPFPAAVEAAHWAKTCGVTTVWDADFYEPESEQLLPLIDICIASEHFARAMAPDLDGATLLRRIPSPVLIVTLGSKGAVGWTPEGEFRIPAFEVPVVDTTGAGDVFHGAYVAALWRGYSFRRAAIYASAAAALKCQAIGGRRGIPTHPEIMQFLASRRIWEE
ncbi:MAG TPA: PfkB family carbohydrate kinase [Symbiobacteriaceae bacterium]